MAQAKLIAIGPTTVPSSAGNLAAPAAAGAGAVGYTATADALLIKRIRIVNRTGASVNYSQWVGATGASAAGTEFGWSVHPVLANSFIEMRCDKRLEGTNGFLTGLAGSANALTFEADAEVLKA
jgi:hypothetical protein